MKRIIYSLLIITSLSTSIFSHEGKETFVLREVARIHAEIFSEKSDVLDTSKLTEMLKGEPDRKKDLEYFRKAIPISEEIGKTKDLNKKRELFLKLSEALEPIIGHHDKSGVSVFYCPMLKRKWLAEGKNIRNPYDSKMKSCGVVVSEAE
ncbi:LIC13259/LIC11441 family protein [Leptospira idonii]|uniref:DUF3347 domain-containing protein n=1 Tax=Leptospira idonii TaxID=1193500 RepID=A0A4R9LYZ6_9LEPT|nr:DUF3347 domain-containing protein [Leptospira idonii]TGN18841.1 DUF3347 domain-containing protein [Leptospira idonii]